MKAQVVSFRCTLKNKLGRVIGQSFARDVHTHVPSESAPLRGLAEGLQDLKGGEKRRIVVSADRAYGFYDPAKVRVVSRESFDGQPMRVGENVMVEGDPARYRVTHLKGDEITLDANHPLAGQDLIFEIETLQVRDALPEEV